jgi:hypothetical protein
MDTSAVTQLYRIVINANAQAIWNAITLPEWTEKYGYGGRVEYELKASGRFSHRASAEMKAMGMPDEIIVGKVIESDPPRSRLGTPSSTQIFRRSRPRASRTRSTRARAVCACHNYARRHGCDDGRRYGARWRRPLEGWRRLAVGA